MPDYEIVRADDPRCAELEAAGYEIVGESWAGDHQVQHRRRRDELGQHRRQRGPRLHADRAVALVRP
ncbi:hypothetical protein [Kribbella steppae]|uniref:hypothetical protein n=1 Tax=Kribbella steppae TaxID=2512223 RepID=UPI001049DF10|nr:hypothetical protein [Kribbella steppae]